MVTTLAEGWYVDGVLVDRWASVTDCNGVSLNDRVGWDDTPGLRGEDVTLLGRHGVLWRRKRFGPGRKTLALTVHAAGGSESDPATARLARAAYEERLDGLMRLFAPSHRRLLSVERVHANGDRRQAECQVISGLTPSVIGQSAGTLTVELSVPSGFWEDVDAITHNLGYDVSGADEQTLECFSLAGQTAPCADAVVVVTGPCDTVSVYDDETGSGFAYGSAVAEGEVLTVDAGAFTALLDSTSVITDLVLADQQILEISDAPSADRGPSLVVTATNAAAGFTVAVTARRKWLR